MIKQITTKNSIYSTAICSDKIALGSSEILIYDYEGNLL